jgi:hypothetical protein
MNVFRSYVLIGLLLFWGAGVANADVLTFDENGNATWATNAGIVSITGSAIPGGGILYDLSSVGTFPGFGNLKGYTWKITEANDSTLSDVIVSDATQPKEFQFYSALGGSNPADLKNQTLEQMFPDVNPLFAITVTENGSEGNSNFQFPVLYAEGSHFSMSGVSDVPEPTALIALSGLAAMGLVGLAAAGVISLRLRNGYGREQLRLF